MEEKKPIRRETADIVVFFDFFLFLPPPPVPSTSLLAVTLMDAAHSAIFQGMIGAQKKNLSWPNKQASSSLGMC